jgi:hypothetical protein
VLDFGSLKFNFSVKTAASYFLLHFFPDCQNVIAKKTAYASCNKHLKCPNNNNNVSITDMHTFTLVCKEKGTENTQ